MNSQQLHHTGDCAPLTHSQRASATCIALIAVAVFALLFTGCAQDSDQKVKTDNVQSTPTPVATDQSAATQGSTVNVWVVNAPGKSTLPNTGGIDLGTGDGSSLAGLGTCDLENGTNSANANSIATAKAGYQQSGITVNVTTGGTAPSLTGSATGAPNVGLTSNANTTQNPELRARGEVSAAMPIAVAMPGGMNDQQATATGRGTTSGTSKTSENELTYTQFKGQVDQLAKALETLKQLQAANPAVQSGTLPVPANEVLPPVVVQTNATP